MEPIEQFSVATSWILDPRLRFEFKIGSDCSTMHISRRSSIMRNCGTQRWQCFTESAISCSSPPITWGDIRQHPSAFNLLRPRRYHLLPQLSIVGCVSVPLERRLQLCSFKMNIKVNIALPLWQIVLLQRPLLYSSISHGGLLHTRLPVVLLRKNRRFSIAVGVPETQSVVNHF
jgi:hypothetical protein